MGDMGLLPIVELLSNFIIYLGFFQDDLAILFTTPGIALNYSITLVVVNVFNERSNTTYPDS
jgi:hypothetical protein